jgi:antitoxin (DNA-binding transcriptional repressor) of toxin-antitoxin stability system
MDEVARTGTALVITKNGKPVAELVPHHPPARNARGILKDELFVTGDIIGPIDAGWDALRWGRSVRVPHGEREKPATTASAPRSAKKYPSHRCKAPP